MIEPMPPARGPAPRNANPTMTPAGLQSLRTLALRRWSLLAVTLVSYLALLLLAARIFGAAGWTPVTVLAMLCFAICAPWHVLGLWNSALGLWLAHRPAKRLNDAIDCAGAGLGATPLQLKTAIVMTLRNEDPERAIGRLRTM